MERMGVAAAVLAAWAGTAGADGLVQVQPLDMTEVTAGPRLTPRIDSFACSWGDEISLVSIQRRPRDEPQVWGLLERGASSPLRAAGYR